MLAGTRKGTYPNQNALADRDLGSVHLERLYPAMDSPPQPPHQGCLSPSIKQNQPISRVTSENTGQRSTSHQWPCGTSLKIYVHSAKGDRKESTVPCAWWPGLHPLSFASLVLAPLWRFWRHLLTSKVLRICLIRTWPYSLLKWNRRDWLIILLHVLWQTYIFLIKHFPNQSNPLRRKSSFIRSFPKGVREKDFSKETKQRGCVWGGAGEELSKEAF